MNSIKKRRRTAEAETVAPKRVQPRRAEKLAPLPTAFRPIFFSHPAQPPSLSGARGRKVRLLCADPAVYEIDDFLTEAELRHLDAIVSQQDALPGAKGFSRSFTDTSEAAKGSDDNDSDHDGGGGTPDDGGLASNTSTSSSTSRCRRASKGAGLRAARKVGANSVVVSSERTSTFFHLRKFGDAKVSE